MQVPLFYLASHLFFYFTLNTLQAVSDLAKVFGSLIRTPVLACVVVRLNCFSL